MFVIKIYRRALFAQTVNSTVHGLGDWAVGDERLGTARLADMRQEYDECLDI